MFGVPNTNKRTKEETNKHCYVHSVGVFMETGTLQISF